MITLATLKDATAQQVFDQVVEHLRKQGEQCSNEYGRCLYRHPSKDLKCAAGCLIADDEYSPILDDSGVDDDAPTWWRSHVNLLRVPSEHSKLIQALQSVHDDVNSWSHGGLESNFIELACTYNLVYKPKGE